MSSPFLPDKQSYYELYKVQSKLNNFYVIGCHFIPFITLPLYAEAFYCVLYKCKQFSPKYVTVLQAHMFLHFVGEIYWTVFLIPVIVIPSIGVATKGFLSDFKISPSWQLFIMCGILQISTATMIHLLIYRLKFAIPPDVKYRKTLLILADIVNIGYYIVTILCTCAFTLMDEDQDVAKNRILEKFLVPPPNLWEQNFVTTDRENPTFPLYLSITIAEITILAANIISIPTLSFHFLSKNNTGKSAKLAEAHRSALRVLVFQVAVHCIFHLFPLMLFTYAVIFRTSSVHFLSIGMFIWALHGAACTLALILGNKPFRSATQDHIKYVFCCLCCKSTPESVHIGQRRESTVIQKIDISNSK